MHGVLAPPGAPLLVWLATLVADERRAIRNRISLTRRALYSATLPYLTRLEASVLTRAERVLTMSSHTADLVVRDGLVPASRVKCGPVQSTPRSSLRRQTMPTGREFCLSGGWTTPARASSGSDAS